MSPDRLSPLDASFLHIEDHVSHMHIASVAIFEGPPPPFADIVAMVDAKLDLVPRYRQKVRFVPFELGRPVWVDDPHFNIEYHLRHTALPAPGGESELRKLVGRVMAQQLDRSKPLWEIWVVEGLEDGRWAMLAKTHHALVDGVSGTDLLAVIMDLSPETERPRALGVDAPPGALGRSSSMVDALENIVRSPYEQLRAARAQTRAVRRMAGYALEVAGGLFALSGLVRPTPLSSLNGPLGPHRRYAWATTSVDDIKRVRKALGGTFNDVVLACITNGFRELLLSRDEDVDRVVRTLVPVSVRPRDESGQGGRRRHVREQGLGDVRRAPGRHRRPRRCACTPSPTQMKDLKDSKQAVAGEALTSMSGFAPADAARARACAWPPGPASATSTRSRRTSRAPSSRSTPPGGG